MKTHSALVRAAPKGTNWWRCVDCMQEGPAGDLMKIPCPAIQRLPHGEAFLSAVGGTGDFAPDSDTQ